MTGERSAASCSGIIMNSPSQRIAGIQVGRTSARSPRVTPRSRSPNWRSSADCTLRANGRLLEADYQHIKVDVCNKCHGVWFDAGELAQVIDKDKQGGWFSKLFD